MDVLDSFVAGTLLKRVLRSSRDDRLAACTSFQGAALFVDISGYTSLAETLCDQGPAGVEALGSTLDAALRRQVRAVRETGGEIASFAGDAFIAYWPADDGNVAGAVRRARACARTLHVESGVRLPASNPGFPEVPGPSGAGAPAGAAPPLHIGVGAGNLWAARLGAEERWQLLLAGGAVRDACMASARAAPGGTIVAAAAEPYDLVSSLETEPVLPTELEPACDDSQGLAHVPKRVQEYIEKGYTPWLSQRRSICALFVRIDGLDDTAADALTRHQAAVASLHVALRPFTGSSGTLLLDDKGLVFTLCLGMPHDAHADDGLRAVSAGLAIRDELARLGLDCAIGVAAGPGVCMPLGGPERRHYWSVGRFMHVAARLMQAADHELLCTEEIADQVRRAFSLSPERSLALKGSRWPVRTFRVHRAVRDLDRAEQLFGREDEQAILDRCLDGFERQRGAVVWMVGDAGLGKTALVGYLRRAAADRRLTCLSGGAGSAEIAVPYAAWRPVFAGLLAETDGKSVPSSEARRGLLSGVRHPQLAGLINAVVPGFLEETSIVRSLSGQARADATVSLLSEVITLRATSRFVLVLEDCHWMDTASWRLALRLAQECPQALILITSRPELDVQELLTLRRLDRFTEIELTPLRSEAIESVVEHVLAERSASRELVEQVVERAMGNPLFAREYALLLAAREAGREARREKTRPEPRAGADSLPVTVQGLIASRLDSLPPAESLALKAASVLGERFSADLLAGAVETDQPADGSLESMLTSLEERQLIARAAGDPRSFVFHHALIREVAYAELTEAQRRNLHQRVAASYQRQYGANLAPHVAALAHHWSQAGFPETAVRYADQAASQALAAGAFEEADRLLRDCIEWAAGQAQVSTADRIRWHRQMADARHGMGQLESRKAAAHDALRLAGLRRPYGTVALIAQATMRLLGRTARRRVRIAGRAVEASTTLDIARAYRHSGEVCYFSNDMLGMVCDSFSAVIFAESLKPSAVLAGASTELGGILSVAGLRRIGERMLRRAITMAEAADDQAAQAYAHMISCLYYVGVGDWGSAERSAKRCQELCEPMDDRVNWTNAQAVRFWMSHYRSHDAAAYDAARSLRDRAGETGNRQHRAWGFRFLGLCALRGGDSKEAVAQLQAALECLDETAALNERIPTLGILALAQLRSDDRWAARATATEGLAQMGQVRRPIGHSTLEGYSSLLTVALEAWREDGAPQWRRAITRCLRLLRRYEKGFPVGEPRLHLHRGEYQRLSGATNAARRSFRRGEAAAIRLGMPWDAKRCREALEDGSLSPDRP